MGKEKPSKKEVLHKGICQCFEAPMSRDRLEGFVLDDEYRFEFIVLDPAKWVRVYLPDESFETCTSTVFNRYFKIISILNKGKNESS